MRKIFVINTIAAIFLSIGSAARCDTLGSLAESCADENLYSMGYCTGYLGAMVDVLDQPAASAKDRYGVCFGKITNQMLFDAVSKGVTQHPELKSVHASHALIKVFQESFPCDPQKRAAVKDAKVREQRADFLSKCSMLPIEPRKGEKEAACVCMLELIAGRVDLTSGNHASNAGFLFESEAKDLEKEIAEYPEKYGFNMLGLDRIYMKALATCF